MLEILLSQLKATSSEPPEDEIIEEVQFATITAPNPVANEYFSSMLSVDTDGSTLAVGSVRDSGTVFLYKYHEGGYQLFQTITFGGFGINYDDITAVSRNLICLSGDGTHLSLMRRIGSTGAAEIYRKNSEGIFEPLQIVSPFTGNTPISSVLTNDGSKLFVTDAGVNTMMVYEKDSNGVYQLKQTIGTSGWYVDCSPDGKVVLATSSHEASGNGNKRFQIFKENDAGTYEILQTIIDSGGSGFSHARARISDNKEYIVTGDYSSAKTIVYKLNSATGLYSLFETKTLGQPAEFDISSSGGTIVNGNPGSNASSIIGSANVFRLINGKYELSNTFYSSTSHLTDRTGHVVRISGNGRVVFLSSPRNNGVVSLGGSLSIFHV